LDFLSFVCAFCRGITALKHCSFDIHGGVCGALTELSEKVCSGVMVITTQQLSLR
jgi:hypothetical protein